ncbi:hypothetical protein ACFFJT_05560 [Dyella flava]|uniref:Uncharacterized protein n=1 Tax=Dyella flava TaxID=1920170 RepID=A0ABS2K238_9GAMM|nr:hypothetical protein [Dyella flava]MBM7124705.1 hypothetical protein [Dyella flava]GLQ50751.1 hypothetical protein GCM10010872_22000 [Dyella flava]
MSENWTYLIPDDPHFIPETSKQEAARRKFCEIARGAKEIELSVNEHVKFQDCGANFERIRCPGCCAEIPMSWWLACMKEDFDGQGFRIAVYATPCCASNTSLHNLAYEWPQGMYRFALGSMNGSFGRLDDGHRQEIEEILGCKLRVIYQHV